MKNDKRDGKILPHTAAANIASGDVVLIGARIGIAVTDIANGAVGSLDTEGVFEIKKKSGDTFAQGAVCYWDNTNKEMTSTSSGNTAAGYAAAVAGSSATVMLVKINA